MSEIIIDSSTQGITVEAAQTQLNVFTGGYACAQGNTTEVQFNNGGVLAGANGLTYNQGSQTTTAGNLVVTNNTDLGDVGNITITGGNSGEYLQTDGSGVLTWAEIANANFASFAGNIITAAQPNITSVGNLSNLTVTGNVTANYFLGNGSQLTGLADPSQIANGSSNVRVLANSDVTISVGGNANILVANNTGIKVNRANLGSVANLNITGGNNGMVLQTDGTGNLSWTAMTGNAGNGTVGGSNTQIQYNDAGAFGGTAGFTFNKTTNAMATPGNITANGNIAANFFIGDGSQLTNVVITVANISNGNSNVAIASNAGNITMSVNGTANVVVVSNTLIDLANANLTLGNGIITGNGNGLSSIVGANVTGTVANSTHACTANTVTNAAQSNITSLGTLTVLDINGNLVAANITANTGIITGNGNGLSSLQASNIVGIVANANYAFNAGNANSAANANYANTAGSANTAATVTTNAQPNITSVGTLTDLTVTGNVTAGGVKTDNLYYANGTPWDIDNPGGSNNTIQYNDNESFGGSSAFTFDPTTNVVTLTGNITSNNANLGNAVNANYFIGNLYGNANIAREIANGNSNVRVFANSDVTISLVGVANRVVFDQNAARFISYPISQQQGANNIGIDNGRISMGLENQTLGMVTRVYNNNTSDTARTEFYRTRGNSNVPTAVIANDEISNLRSYVYADSGNINYNTTTLVDTVNSNDNNGNVVSTFQIRKHTSGDKIELYSPLVKVTSNGSNNTLLYGNGDITTIGNITANIFSGNANGLSNIPGANVTGTVANANFATTANNAYFAGNVTNAAQPNITSVGTLTGLDVNGNVTAANITANTGVFTGNAAGLTNIPAGNVNGQVANALVAGTVYINSQPNITSVGTLGNLTVSGNIGTNNFTATNFANANNISATSNISANNANFTEWANANNISATSNISANNANFTQWANANNINATSNISANYANFTQWANANNINVTNNVNATVGNFTGNVSANFFFGDAGFLSNLGPAASQISNGNSSVTVFSNSNVRITVAGTQTANFTANGITMPSVYIGSVAGLSALGSNTLAIGYSAGLNYTGARGVVIGGLTGDNGTGNDVVAIGAHAGRLLASNAIAIGSYALGNIGNTSGLNSIAIGANAGYPNAVANNTIVINASGSNLNAATANALFIKPVRTVNSTVGLNQLYYNSTTGEIVVYVP